MSLRINQNVLSLRTYGTLSETSDRLSKSIQKLSTGLRINSASDDAAGLAISEKMRRQIRGLDRSVLNAQDGISMLQTAEGAMNESHSILQRMRELAVQSSNDTLTSNDRLEIQKEVGQLKDDLNRISHNTEFNTKKLLDGTQTALVSSNSNSAEGIVTGMTKGSGDYNVSIALITGGISQMQRSQTFTVNDGSGKLANGTTQLQSISQFYDSNGVFVLGTTQTLTLNGNGKEAQVSLDGQMTLDNLASDLQNALVSKSGLELSNSKSGVVNTVQTKIAGVGGYLELTSGTIGDSGRYSFAGEQNVMDALGFSVQREAVNSKVELSTTDSFGNLSSSRTEQNVASGLLDGVDVHFTSQSAQIAGTSGIESGLQFTANQTFSISVANTQGNFNVAGDATRGWTMEGIARSINSQIAVQISGGSTGLQGLSASVVDGEIRMSYSKPSSASVTVGNTIVIASATTGASSIGFTDGTYSGFADAIKDKNAETSGFSRYVSSVTYAVGGNTAITFDIGDGAGGPVTITLMHTIGTGSAAMLQAPDMVKMTTFQANVNSALAGTVAVRLDPVGAAMAFTSTRVGNENRDNTTAYTSMVTLTGISAGKNMILDKFGLSEGTSKGSGDSNFRIHVKDNSSQFQIGADQGEVMKVGISNMSTKALGIDNLDLTSVTGANEAMGKIDRAIDLVSSERAKIGAFQNRLSYAINNLRSSSTNMVSSESRIRDTDIAKEMIEFTRDQIMQQSGTAMLAQANSIPKGVLSLLGGK